MRQMTASACCNVALISIAAPPSAEAFTLGLMRDLKQHGFKIIAYGDGALAWPLGLRCLPLLAGAMEVLDSADVRFTECLHELLFRTLAEEAAVRAEEHRLKEKMRGLGLVGESPAMLSIFRTIVRVSKLSDLPMLITGETGTGKERVAQAIHRLDPKRGRGPFVAVNCGAISAALMESELFGHRRGAFTGAERDRAGLIRAAEGGVLFLDEISELDLAAQAKLLRVLQENRVLSVGEDKEISVSVRVLAAANRNLRAIVETGKFRADLFHRLNVFCLHVPPLRERVADLKPLVGHFLQKHRSLQSELPVAVDDVFVEALGRVDLAGNAREVENLVRRALVCKKARTPLNLSDLPADVWQQLSDPERAPAEMPAASANISLAAPFGATPEDDDLNLSRSLAHCERRLLQRALDRAHGNQSKTARLLGITARSVYNKLRKHQLDA
jgi:transcriptional regulator with PAS, ATPase and Fis domain